MTEKLNKHFHGLASPIILLLVTYFIFWSSLFIPLYIVIAITSVFVGLFASYIRSLPYLFTEKEIRDGAIETLKIITQYKKMIFISNPAMLPKPSYWLYLMMHITVIFIATIIVSWFREYLYEESILTLYDLHELIDVVKLLNDKTIQLSMISGLFTIIMLDIATYKHLFVYLSFVDKDRNKANFTTKKHIVIISMCMMFVAMIVAVFSITVK